MDEFIETLGLDSQQVKSTMDYDNYDVNDLPKLTPEEEQIWYSKFYYKGRAQIAPELMEKVAPGNPMNLEDVVPIENLSSLMEEGFNPNDFGYCLLPNGAGYGATRCELPDVTMDMYVWYKQLRWTDLLAYKIWYPGSHMSEVNGVTVEDVGFGVEQFDVFDPLNWEKLKFPCHPAEKDPMFLGTIGSNCWIRNLDYPDVQPRAMCLLHYIRKMENGGIEFRTHIYMGMHCIDGKGVVVQKLRPDICLEATRRMVSHCAYERNNVNFFLPEIYEKMKNQELKQPEEYKDSFPLDLKE